MYIKVMSSTVDSIFKVMLSTDDSIFKVMLSTADSIWKVLIHIKIMISTTDSIWTGILFDMVKHEQCFISTTNGISKYVYLLMIVH